MINQQPGQMGLGVKGGKNPEFSHKGKLKSGIVGPILSFIIVFIIAMGSSLDIYVPWLYYTITEKDTESGSSVDLKYGQDLNHSWEADSQINSIKMGDDEVVELDAEEEVATVYENLEMMLILGLILTLVSIIVAALALSGKVFSNYAMYVSLITGIFLIIIPIYFVMGLADATDLSASEVIHYTEESEEIEGLKFSSNVSWSWILTLIFGIITIITGTFMRDTSGTARKKKVKKQGAEVGMGGDISHLIGGTPIPGMTAPSQSSYPSMSTGPQPGIQQQSMPPSPPQQMPQYPPGLPGQQPFPTGQYPPGGPASSQMQQFPGQSWPQGGYQTPQQPVPPPSQGGFQLRPWTCSNCQTAVESKFAFCTSCGHKRGQ